jgi:hypothetical protein
MVVLIYFLFWLTTPPTFSPYHEERDAIFNCICYESKRDNNPNWAGNWPVEKYLTTYYRPISIALSSVEYFAKSGEVYRETQISGGGGGGSSLGGAIVGGLIAGDAGAVIGSRKSTDAITTKTITHDSRETIISYLDNAQRKVLTLRYKDYQVLDDLIPEKNYEVVTEIKKQGIIQQSIKADKSKAITEQIKELAGLRDNGILTEEEFADKKKELLAKI